METKNRKDMVEQLLNAWLDDLYEQAEKVVEAHWASIRDAEQKIPGWENKSHLRIRIRRKGNALKLEWGKVRWVGSKAKGTRTPLVDYIRKADEYGYNLNTLLGLSRDWEKTLVKNTETRLASIRREWRHVNKAIQTIRFAENARKAAMATDKNGTAEA